MDEVWVVWLAGLIAFLPASARMAGLRVWLQIWSRVWQGHFWARALNFQQGRNFPYRNARPDEVLKMLGDAFLIRVLVLGQLHSFVQTA